MMGTSIKRLPEHVTASVRSTAYASDLPTAACELVLNSIQAGARSIHVTANLPSWSVTVDDDGCGIPAASLLLLGQRFCTSKQAPCTGEALSSLAQLSQQVTVTTRAAGAFETHKKQLVSSASSSSNNRPAQALLNPSSTKTNPSTASCTTLCPIARPRQGTTVTILGFLHNQPVRRNRLLQQHAGGPAAAAAAATGRPPAAAAALCRASDSALQELKLALFVLVLPYCGVELTLQQAGSSVAVLHLPQDRSLPSCLDQLFSQQPSQGAGTLQHIRSQHSAGWQLSGAVLTAPTPALSSKPHQLLYVNSRAIVCPVLAQLLRDWFIRHAKASMGGDTAGNKAAGMPAGSSRTPEPGYVLLITCPAAACSTGRQPASLSLLADFSGSMGPLCDALQAGIGPHWGSLPSLWRKAAAAGTAGGTKPTAFANSSGGRSRAAAGFSAGQPGTRLNMLPGCADMQNPGGKKPWQTPVMPAHGLHMSSHTRSLAGIQATAAVTNNQHHQEQQAAPTGGGSSQQHPQEQNQDFTDMFDGDLAALLAALDDDDPGLAGAAAQHADGNAAAAADCLGLHSWEGVTVHERSGIDGGSTKHQGGSGGRVGRQAALAVNNLDSCQSSRGLVQVLEEQEHLRQQHEGHSAGSGGAGRQQRSSGILSAEISSAGEGRCRASSGLSDAAAHEALLQQELEAALAGSSGGRRCGPRSNRGPAAAGTATTAAAAAAEEEPCGYQLGFQQADLEQGHQQQHMPAAADVDVSWAQCDLSSAALADLEDGLGLDSAPEALMSQRPRQQQWQQQGDAIAAGSSGGSRRRSCGVSTQAAAHRDAAGGQGTTLWDLDLQQQQHSSRRGPSITTTWAAADVAGEDVLRSSVVADMEQECQGLLACAAGSGGAKRRSQSMNGTARSPAVTAERARLCGDLELCADSPEQVMSEQQQQLHHAAAGSGGSRRKRRQRGSSWQPDEQELLQGWQADSMTGAAGSGGRRRQQDDLPAWLSDADADAAAAAAGGGDDSCGIEQQNSILVEPHQQQLLQHWEDAEEGEAMPDAAGGGGRKRQRRNSYQCSRQDQLPAWPSDNAEADAAAAGAAAAGAAAACSHWTDAPLAGDTDGLDILGQLSGQQDHHLEQQQQHQQLVEEELDWLDAPAQLQQHPDSSCDWGINPGDGATQHLLQQQQQRLLLQRSPQPTRLHGCDSGASPMSCWMLEQQQQEQEQQQQQHLTTPRQFHDGNGGVSPMSCWMRDQEQQQQHRQQQQPCDAQPSGASVFWQDDLMSLRHCPLPSPADRLPDTPMAPSPDHLAFTSPSAAAAAAGAAGQGTTGHSADHMWELSPCMSPLGHQSSQQEQQEHHRHQRHSTGHGRSWAWQDAQARSQQQQEREQQQQQGEQQAHSPSLTELLQQPLPRTAVAQAANQGDTTTAAANTTAAATTATAPGRGRRLSTCLDGGVPFGQAHFPELSTGLTEYLEEGSAAHDTGAGAREGGSAVTAAGSCASGKQQAPEAADSCDAAVVRPTPAAAAAAGPCPGKRAELPGVVVARHTPAAGAAAAVAPCINPSAAAASEDTVQQVGFAAAAAAAAAAVSSADSKASHHDHQPLLQQQEEPPCRGPAAAAAAAGGPPCSPPRTALLPDVLLLPFSERLLMSAPPAAKKPRVFARSGIICPLSSSHIPAGGKTLCSSAVRKAAMVSTTQHSGSRSAAGLAIQARSSKQDAALPLDNKGCAAPSNAAAAAAAGRSRDAAGCEVPATIAAGGAGPVGFPHAVQSRRHRRHTSPAVLQPATQQQQQQQLVAAAASGLQQQQKQPGSNTQQTHKQLMQARLPFRTVNGQLPKGASTPHAAANKHTLAGKLPQKDLQLKPAWQQSGQENGRPNDKASLHHKAFRPGATAAPAAGSEVAAGVRIAAAAGEPLPAARGVAGAAAAAVGSDGVGAASTGLKHPAGALKSSLKGRRVSSSTTSQQQQQQQEQEGGKGEAQPVKPRKRVRFSGIWCSQEPAPEVDAANCSRQQQTQQVAVAAHAAAQDTATAVAGVAAAAAAAGGPAATSPADAAAAAPQPTTPQGLVHDDEHIQDQPSTSGCVKGDKDGTPITASGGGNSQKSRFFQSNSLSSMKATPHQADNSSSGSRCKKLQPRPGDLSSLSGGRAIESALYGSSGRSTGISLASTCRDAAEGSSSRNAGTGIDVSALPGSNNGSGSSGLLGRGGGLLLGSSASQGPAILSVEELAGAVPGGLVPTSVSRQQLQDGAVIAQADNKLVVVRCGSVLLAVDQHAADERVQLESLQQQLAQQMHVPAAAAAAAATHHTSHSAAEGVKIGSAAGPAASGGLLKQQRLQRPQPLNLSLLEARALQQHQALIESWGWRLAAGHLPGPAAAAAAATQPASSSGGSSSGKAAAAAGGGASPAVRDVAGQGKLSATPSAPAGAAGQPGGRMHTSSSGSSKLEMAAGTPVDSSIKAEQQQPSLAPTPTAGAVTAAAEGGPLMFGTSQAIVLQAVPLLAGVQLGAVDLQLYMHQLLETSGSSTQPPPGVLRVLRSKACRGAIMFGDTLNRHQCEALLRQLGATELCFMCAHGRPTTTPLVDLDHLHARLQQWQQRTACHVPFNTLGR